jgi:transcriptional regulator with XRE-family HTH domain
MTKRRLGKGEVQDWPSVAQLEFTAGLARAMRHQPTPLKQADLARLLDVSPAYISSVMAGHENLTLEQMSRLAAAVGCSVHVAVAAKDTWIRWEEDVLSPPDADVSRVIVASHPDEYSPMVYQLMEAHRRSDARVH